MMDYLVYGIGAIIIAVATLLAYLAGKRKGIQLVSTDDQDSVSLRGLSHQGKEKLKGYVQIVQVWDLHRRPDKDRFKPVHYD